VATTSVPWHFCLLRPLVVAVVDVAEVAAAVEGRVGRRQE
jgi:hypothetical protein